MLSKNKTLFIVAIIVLQLSILLGLVAYKEFELERGVELIVKLRPVDPRSLMQGDYVILDYDFAAKARRELRNNKTTILKPIVLLKKEGGEPF